MLSLDELIAAAKRDGVAWTDGGIERLESRLHALKWALVPSRDKEPGLEVLKPSKEEEAHQRSMSARYGLGRQPLHTDGAHLLEPPDVLLLSAEKPSPVGTRYWRYRHQDVPEEQREDFHNGLFTVRSGKNVFLAPALGGMAQVRWDPVCMSPADARARRVSSWLSNPDEAKVATFEWSTPGLVLAIDNRHVMHGRDDSVGHEDRAMKRLAIRLPRGTQ